MYAQYTTNILTGLTTFKNIPKALYIELMTITLVQRPRTCCIYFYAPVYSNMHTLKVIPILYFAAVWCDVVLSVADQVLLLEVVTVPFLTDVRSPLAIRTSRKMKVASTATGMVLSSQWFIKWPVEYM